MRFFHNLNANAKKPKSWVCVRDYKPREQLRAERALVRPTPKQRFEDKFIPVTESGCWLWTAAMGTKGYGKFGFGGRKAPYDAHRASWLIYRGEIPDGLMVLHKCDVRACVNPNHLFLGTAHDNTHDMMRKGRYTPWNRGLTHCKYGHELAGENLYPLKNGRKACRECKNRWGRHYSRLRKQRTLSLVVPA